MAVLPAVQAGQAPGTHPTGVHDDGQPGTQTGTVIGSTPEPPHHVLLATLPLLVLPQAAAQEVDWLFKAMVKEEAEQVGVPVPARFVEDTPYSRGGLYEVFDPQGPIDHSQVGSVAPPSPPTPGTPPSPPPLPAQAVTHIGGQERAPSQAPAVDVLYTAATMSSMFAGSLTQSNTGIWVQHQSVPLHRVGGLLGAAGGGLLPGAGQLNLSERWSSDWPASALQQVQEEGRGGGQQLQGPEQPPALSASPGDQARRHGWVGTGGTAGELSSSRV
jgi:hypothetical protein